MLALPYITVCTGFKGVIYATEPTLHIGRYVCILLLFLSSTLSVLDLLVLLLMLFRILFNKPLFS